MTKATLGQLALSLPAQPLYLYVLPLTTKKSFIFCHHSNAAFPGGKPNMEHKLVDKFSNVWTKFSNSDKPINKKIVGSVNSFLSRISWVETCFLSIPSHKHITRLVTEDIASSDKKLKGQKLSYTQLNQYNLDSKQLANFNMYFPAGLTNPSKIIQSLKPMMIEEQSRHKRALIRDILLLPLTIPIALIPLFPNVPGFFLLYRIWCHLKVMAAVKHFAILWKDKSLDYIPVEGIKELYMDSNDKNVRIAVENYISKFKVESHEQKEVKITPSLKIATDDSPVAHDPDHPQQIKQDTETEGHYSSDTLNVENNSTVSSLANAKINKATSEAIDSSSDEEKLLISEDIAPRLCELFNDPATTSKLLFAIKQERERLQK
ncbi:Mrx19 protein [Martiniozyma asiatica (nom. inval.)]|nr:Mrx19 protein [Martiniozyma asiatica]